MMNYIDVGGLVMITYIDLNRVSSYIMNLIDLKVDMKNLTYDTLQKKDSAGMYIENIEKANGDMDELRNNFITLLEHTISYLSERKESIEEKEKVSKETIEK